MKLEEKPLATNMRQWMISLLYGVLPIRFKKTNNGIEKNGQRQKQKLLKKKYGCFQIYEKMFNLTENQTDSDEN